MLNKTIDPSNGSKFKDRRSSSRQYNKSYDPQTFNVTKNFRVKTEDFQQRAFKVRINQKRITTLNAEASGIYHPDIYHRPEVRKKYFCQLVDSYINNKKAFDQKESIINTNTIERYVMGRRNNFYKTIQTAFDVQQSSKYREQSKSRKKRASTAGYTRKRQENSNLKQINEKKIVQKANQHQNQQQLDEERYKCSGNAQLKINLYLKNKANNRLNILNNYLKISNKNIKIIKQRQQTFTAQSKSKYDPGIDSLESSIIESHGKGQKYKEIPIYSNSKLIQDQQKTNSKMKGKVYNRYIQTSMTINSSIQQSRSRSRYKSIQSHESVFSFLSLRKKKIQAEIDQQQKEKVQKQINLRLKMINPQYGKLKWRIDHVHDYNIYKIFDISGFQEKFLTQIRNNSRISKNNSLSNTLIKKGSIVNIKIKKYSQDSIPSNIKDTIEKAYNIGVSQFWKKLPKDPLVKRTDQFSLYYSYNKKSLRQQLFQFTLQQKSKQQKAPIYKIQAKTLYYELFHNNCQYLKDIIRSIATDLIKMKGKLINNKISLDNIYRLQQKAIKIGDWGCSALCRTIKVNGSQITFRDLPILKNQQNQQDQEVLHSNWLLHPQNLPPQIILSLMKGNYSKVWENYNCPEIWSIGILIFQILTWIPVWMPYQAQVQHKFPKCGYIYDSYQRLSQIYTLQCKIPAIVSRWLRDQKNSLIYKQIDPQILALMKSMLQINFKLRPQPQQVIKRLQVY